MTGINCPDCPEGSGKYMAGNEMTCMCCGKPIRKMIINKPKSNEIKQDNKKRFKGIPKGY